MIIESKNLNKIILNEHDTILKVIKNLNKSGLKVVLIVGRDNNFLGIINDGDVRRGFAKGYDVKTPARYFLNKKTFYINNLQDLKKISPKNLSLYYSIPVIRKKKIKNLYIHSIDADERKKIREHVVLMAGGFGKRLGLLTKNCPKALLRFNRKPLIQHIIEYLKKNNVENIIISLFFLKTKIKKFILKNNFFSTKIKFLEENNPMGSIGSLKLIRTISTNFIVLNCDVITDINLKNLLNFHKRNRSIMTMCVKNFQYTNPYGVINSKKNRFISFEEKPEINFSINAGVYVFNKKVIQMMKKYQIENIENLIFFLKKRKYRIRTYQIFENWRDFGSDKKNLKIF